MSTSYFVAADWLIEHGDDPEVQIIDARMAPPGREHRDVPGEYRAGHLPGAVFLISKPSPITPPSAAHAAAPGSLLRSDARAGHQQRQTPRCL